MAAKIEQTLLFYTYLNCDVIAPEKSTATENDVPGPLYFYFKSNFKHDNK